MSDDVHKKTNEVLKVLGINAQDDGQAVLSDGQAVEALGILGPIVSMLLLCLPPLEHNEWFAAVRVLIADNDESCFVEKIGIRQ